MNDPLTWAQTTSSAKQVQSKCGQMLPDRDLSKEQHEQISRESFAAWKYGINDIGAIQASPEDYKEKEGNSIVLPQRLNVPENYLESHPKPTVAQAQALLKEQKRQEEMIAKDEFVGYVRGVDYGKEDPALTAEQQKELERKVIENAKQFGVELKGQTHE